MIRVTQSFLVDVIHDCKSQLEVQLAQIKLFVRRKVVCELSDCNIRVVLAPKPNDNFLTVRNHHNIVDYTDNDTLDAAEFVFSLIVVVHWLSEKVNPVEQRFSTLPPCKVLRISLIALFFFE